MKKIRALTGANATNLDIYGKWMSPDGKTFSDEIVFCDDPGVQRYSSVSYAEKSNRIMVAWQDIVDEDLQPGRDRRSIRAAH